MKFGILIGWYLFLESILILYRYAQGLLSQDPPSEWQDGESGDVILIQGFTETFHFLSSVADDLNKSGYRIHVISEISRGFQEVRKSVNILEAYIQTNNLSHVILVSHSKGGIIAKSVLNRNPDRVDRIITFAAPWHGTIFGFLRILNLFELIPGNTTIQDIVHIPFPKEKILNLFPQIDNFIIPKKSLELPGAKNREIPVIGHTRLLEDNRIYFEIKTFLGIADVV